MTDLLNHDQLIPAAGSRSPPSAETPAVDRKPHSDMAPPAVPAGRPVGDKESAVADQGVKHPQGREKGLSQFGKCVFILVCVIPMVISLMCCILCPTDTAKQVAPWLVVGLLLLVGALTEVVQPGAFAKLLPFIGRVLQGMGQGLASGSNLGGRKPSEKAAYKGMGRSHKRAG